MMENLTSNDMREHFKNSGLTYSEDVTKYNISLLHAILTQELFLCENFHGTYRMNPKIEFRTRSNKSKDFIFAGVTCDAHYFDGREAVSFNGDGFIGFCGWADSINNQPILRGFKKWVDLLSSRKEVS